MARRFFIFSIGLLLGSVLVYQILIKDTDREFYGSWLPEGRVLKKIRTGLDKHHAYLNCWTDCANIFNSDVDVLLESGDVDFSQSKTKGTEKQYIIETELENGELLTMGFGLIKDSVFIQYIETSKAAKYVDSNCGCD